MKYETVIGLEVHTELATESKLFCSCSAKFGADANENVCPACAGMPGMPAVTNKRAVELAIAAAIVTNSEITPVMTFDKKNYFYPDLPAGYQITQWFAPICRNGWIEIETADIEKQTEGTSTGDAGAKAGGTSPGAAVAKAGGTSTGDAESKAGGTNPGAAGVKAGGTSTGDAGAKAGGTNPGDGKVSISTDAEAAKYGKKSKRITLKQIHIEEDAGKLVHDPRTRSSLVDFNRTSVPLVEIVSNPDFRSADEVIAYLEKLRALLSFAGVSDCKMQEGSMRCDINISVRETGSRVLGTRTEIKNMNSLKAIARAIEYETQRHIDALETGCETLIQETRRWDDDSGMTFSMREKEEAADYRYFPNPELLPIHIGKEWIESVRNALPEPAHEKFNRMTEQLGLPEPDSKIITSSLNLSRIFDDTLRYINKPKEVVNWIVGDLLSIAKAAGKSDDDITIDKEKFAKVIKLVDNRIINRAMGKKLLAKVFEENIDPETYVEENALGIISETGFLETAIREVLAENEKSVVEYREGNQKVLGFFVGKVMKKAAGKADPRLVNELLIKALEL